MFENVSVKKIMNKSVISAQKKLTLKEVKEIFAKHNIHHLPILDGEILIGIVSSNDVHAAEMIGAKVGDTMSKIAEMEAVEFMQKEIVSINIDGTVMDALKYFLDHKIHALLVMEKSNELSDSKLAGIITTHDIINFLLKACK